MLYSKERLCSELDRSLAGVNGRSILFELKSIKFPSWHHAWFIWECCSCNVSSLVWYLFQEQWGFRFRLPPSIKCLGENRGNNAIKPKKHAVGIWATTHQHSAALLCLQGRGLVELGSTILYKTSFQKGELACSGRWSSKILTLLGFQALEWMGYEDLHQKGDRNRRVGGNQQAFSWICHALWKVCNLYSISWHIALY